MGLPAELFGGRGAGEVAESLRCCGRFSPCRWQTRADLCSWNDSFGNQVLIDDGAGLSTRYAHMTATAVSPGAVVTAGQVIGYVGSTGDSTGNHLHFEVSVGGTLADPLEYVLPQ